MTQEILGYLLIRSLILNCSEDALIEEINDEEAFAYMIENIYLLMQEEDFLFVSPVFKDKVINFISKYRFDYIKNKEYCEQMNYIIGRFRDYELMSDDRKKYIVDNWIEEESKNRELPKCYQNIKNLFKLISLDALYIKGIVTIGEEFMISNIVEYVSIINIIMNKFPECFEDELFLEVTRSNLGQLKRIRGLGLINSKMVKKAYKKINENYQQVGQIDAEISYTLKKTKK